MSDSQLAAENYERYCYVRDYGHLKYVQKAKQCRSYFFGRQWDPAVKAMLNVAKRPAFTINEIFAQLVTVCGEHIENKADVSFVETASGTSEVAHALTKTNIHIKQTNNYDHIEGQVFMSGMMTSRGFIDVRAAFNDQLMGEMRYKYLKAQNVLVDPDADTYDPDEWKECFITYWLSPNDIELNYGAHFAKELRGRTSSAYMYGYDSVDIKEATFGGAYSSGPMYTPSADADLRRYIRVLERQFKQIRQVEHFVDPETGDMRAIPYNWERNRVAFVKDKFQLEVIKMPKECIRWRISADNLLLHDEESPLKHFTPVPFFPYFFEGESSGMVEQLIDAQDMLNKSISSEVHILNSVANSGWQMEENSLVNMTEQELKTVGAETGLVLVRKQGTQPIEKIQPNQVPQGFERIGYKAVEFIKELSGVSDSKRGFDRADVAAKAILAKQRAGSLNLTLPLNNMVHTRRLVARNTADGVQAYYTEERVVRITNSRDPAAKVEEITLNQWDSAEGRVVNDLTVGEYGVVVTDVPSRETFQDSQFQEAIQMREMGVMIPDTTIIKHSHLQDKSQIIEEMAAPPSPEEAAVKQAEMQLAQLEVKLKEADILKKKADAALTLARSRSEGKAEQDPAVAQAQELALDRERMLAELQIKREELAANIQLKREESRMNRSIKLAEAEANIEMTKKSQETKDDIARKSASAKKADGKARPAGNRNGPARKKAAPKSGS